MIQGGRGCQEQAPVVADKGMRLPESCIPGKYLFSHL